jgi:prepilin peptidase CpaA
MRLFGGGDTKIGSALALWVGLKGMMLYLFYMAIIGGVLGILGLMIKKKNLFAEMPSGSWPAQVRGGRNAVPYGIALCIGAWMSFFHTGLLHDALNELSKIIH